MNRRTLAWLFVLGLVGWLSPLSARADAMRCGTHLVKEGSAMPVVLSECGKPAEARQWVEQRSYPVTHSNGTVTVFTENVTIDQWTYDFGPNEFVYVLTWANGKMGDMARGSWGKAR